MKYFRVSNPQDCLVLIVRARSLESAAAKLRQSPDFQLPAGQYLVCECGNATNALSIELSTNTFIVTVKVPKSVMDTIKGYLNAKAEDKFQGEDNTISYTAVFPDGKQMDVKCCGCRDESSWTEAVLFDKNGCELCCSEPEYKYAGTWELEHEGVKYVAVVNTEKK